MTTDNEIFKEPVNSSFVFQSFFPSFMSHVVRQWTFSLQDHMRHYTMPYKYSTCTREFMGAFLFPFQSSFP